MSELIARTAVDLQPLLIPRESDIDALPKVMMEYRKLLSSFDGVVGRHRRQKFC